MKRYTFFLILLLSTAFTMSAQSAPDAPELTRLLNEFLAGAGKNDAAVHERFWAKDLIYTRSTGVRTNKEEIMKGFKTPSPAPKPDAPVTVYTAEDVQIHQYGNAAVVAFKLVINTARADGTKTVSNNLNTGTFIKRKGKWQVVAWQSTIVPKPEPTSGTGSQTTGQNAASTTGSKLATVTSNGPATGARTYMLGSRGGCYYLNSKGAKAYVDKSNCK